MATRLNRCLNEEAKYYGLSRFGLIGGVVIGGLMLVKFGMSIGIISTVAAFAVFAHIGTYWHKGIMQRFLYWHIPLKQLLGCKYLPNSHERCLS